MKVRRSNTLGDMVANTWENLVDVAPSLLPPVFSQGAWLLLRPSVWAAMLTGKAIDALFKHGKVTRRTRKFHKLKLRRRLFNVLLRDEGKGHVN